MSFAKSDVVFNMKKLLVLFRGLEYSLDSLLYIFTQREQEKVVCILVKKEKEK